MRRFFWLMIIALVAGSPGALELEQGDLRVELDERSSRFAVLVRSDSGWLSLFFPDDLLSTSVEVLEENQVFRMGDSGRFSQRVEQAEFGPRFVWESATLRISQTFEPIRGLDSVSENGVQIRTSVLSLAEQPREVGVRFILDSYLGERQNRHFELADGSLIEQESRIDPADTLYVVSRNGSNAQSGLQLMIGTPTVTRPEAVYLTNWQRASESPWNYDFNPTRNFNRLPYSINDSAILLRYGTEVLETGERYEVITRLGDIAVGGYADPIRLVGESSQPQTTAEGSDNSELIRRLSELIEEIAALSLSEEIDLDEVLRLQQELQELGERIRGQ
jgi:hypothetical protein